MFQPASGLLPGARWGMLDDYRGESFRRGRDGAEIVASAGAPAETGICLMLEAAEGPADVRLLDAAGHTLGEHRFAGLSSWRVPLARVAGETQVFRLEFAGAAEIRLYHCGWTGPGRASGPGLSQPWGAGWNWDAAAGNMQAPGRAELVVTASEQGAGPLFLELETAQPMDFEIRGGDGGLLASFHAAGRAVHRLDLPLAPGRTHVVSLAAAGPFRAWRCDWTAAPRPRTPTGPAFLHTNGCGDFTLLSRRQWFDLRAYPEFDLFSMNLDSIFCATAHFGGAREEMLEEPMRIYHIEHGSGSGWTPEGQAKLFERIAARGLQFVDNEEVLIWTAQMGRLGAPMIFNHEDWGLDGLELPETVLP